MTAMDLGWAEGGLINDKIIDFYEERARGGTGLICVGGAAPSEFLPALNFLKVNTDNCIKGFRKLNDVLHAFGVKTSLQLLHPGRYAHPALNWGKKPVSSSEVASKLFPEIVL